MRRSQNVISDSEMLEEPISNLDADVPNVDAVGEEPAEASDQQIEPNQGPRDLLAESVGDEELDDLYDADGNARFELDGVPCDRDGNPIPEFRPQAEPETPQENLETPPAAQAPAKAAPTFQSPYIRGLLTDQERERAEQLADPEVLELFSTMMMRAADQVVSARDQQRIVTRQLGIPEEMHEEVFHRMSEVEHLVPQEYRGTRKGANIALGLAAIAEAGDENIYEVFRRWSVPQTPDLPARSPQTPAPVRPKMVMAPSQRTTNARPAPDSARRAPARDFGGLTERELAVIRAERNTFKNGR